jgi:uncharacterized protein (UPF0332 family)
VLIFERTSKVAKTHKGVNKEFHRLAVNEPSLPRDLAASLSETYRFKDIADYAVAPVAKVTQQDAAEAIAAAERFIQAVRAALMRSTS